MAGGSRLDGISLHRSTTLMSQVTGCETSVLVPPTLLLNGMPRQVYLPQKAPVLPRKRGFPLRTTALQSPAG